MRFSNVQVVGLVTIVLALLLGFFSVSLFFKDKEDVNYLVYEREDVDMMLNGDYVSYVELGGEYVEEFAKASVDGKNISNSILVSYFKDDERVTSIDTSVLGDYLVRYMVSYHGKSRFIYRTVIVCDTKAPSITVPKKETITALQALSFDLGFGVVVNDNSGYASLSYDNPLSVSNGDYVITYKAVDLSGNVSVKKRLIKVVSGIEFSSFSDGVNIVFPDDKEYTYKYSLDNGYTWTVCDSKVSVSLKEGTVIGVLNYGDTVMSSSYTKKI